MVDMRHRQKMRSIGNGFICWRKLLVIICRKACKPVLIVNLDDDEVGYAPELLGIGDGEHAVLVNLVNAI